MIVSDDGVNCVLEEVDPVFVDGSDHLNESKRYTNDVTRQLLGFTEVIYDQNLSVS